MIGDRQDKLLDLCATFAPITGLQLKIWMEYEERMCS